MPDGLRPAAPRSLLHDLAPRNAEEKARLAEVERAAAESRVHRRSLPVRTSQFAESVPVWAAGLQAAHSIGPIGDVLGQDIWFDVFHKVKQVRFVRSKGGAPFLALPVKQVIFGGLGPHKSFQLGPGSFWIATRLLAPAAPVDAYSGVRISGGTLNFGEAVHIFGDEVVVSEAVPCHVAITLDPPETSLGIGPGADVRDALFHPSKKVTFDVNGAGATATVTGSSMLGLYGQQVELHPMAGPAVYLPQLNRVVAVKLTPKQTMFAATNVQSTAFRPEGSAPIAAAGWALSVARIDPDDLGEASGVGALMLVLQAGLRATWTGQSEPASLGLATIFLDEARLAVLSPAAGGYAVAQHPLLPMAFARSHLAMTWGRAFPISYFAQAAGTEAIFTDAALSAAFEKPVDVRGERVVVRTKTAFVIFLQTVTGDLLSIRADLVPDTGVPGLGFGLTNAVLRSTLPVSFLLIASWDGKLLLQGGVAIAYGLMGIIPSLPDPYATNVGASHTPAGGGRLMSVARWTLDTSSVEFILPPSATLPTGMLHQRPALQGLTKKAAGDAFAFEDQPRLILLDLSTNVSQFGVALRPPPGKEEDSDIGDIGIPEGPQVAVRGLDLAVDGRRLLLLTLPAVQWEPVACEPVDEAPPFPSRVTFDNSGVPTLIGVPTVKLVPVRPDAALGTILDNFAHPNPQPAQARFTLPFGMVASAVLRKPQPGRGAKVTETRPSTADGMQAGRQLRIDAVDPSLTAGQTPALPGFTVQLPNAVPADGPPGPRSILGDSVTSIFNGYLGSGGTSPLVPVTRADLSGFGETLFSTWNNPNDDETEVSKAEFRVMIGRTAHEVVQVRTILLPYRVPVVRTVTMERRNHGLVTRHDSGWVAAGDGDYKFGGGIVTHRGVVKKMTNVTHIRETGDRVTKNGIEFAAVYYQGDLILEGTSAPIPVAHHFGYVKIGVPPLTPAVYAALIAGQGPLCGPLDTTIRIGNGTQQMRLHRVGVGVTQNGSNPEFVMTAWGALAFPGGGQWSVLYAEDAAGAPQAVPKDEGLPLIREGAAGGPPPTKPYRFADPADLAHESAPARDYGILHATGTQRAFFRRPKIEPAHLSRIVSTQKPVIADPYILATSQGLFPLQSECIPFPSANWALEVAQGGSYKLVPPASFPAGLGRRTVREAGSVRSDLDYSNSKVTYVVDTDQPVPWRFELTKVAKIMGNTALGDVITFISTVNAQAGRETTFDEPSLKLGGSLTVVQDLLTILTSLGIEGAFKTAMTNEWSLKGSLRYPFVNAQGKDFQIPPMGEPRVKLADTGIALEFTIRPNEDIASFDFGGMPMFALELGWFIVIIIHFKIVLSSEKGTEYELLLGLGVAYEEEVNSWFSLQGIFAITWFAIFGDAVYGYGVGFVLKLGASVAPFFSVQISVEGRIARVVIHPGYDDETVYHIAKIVMAFEITFFLCVSIKLEGESRDVRHICGPLPESELPAII
jgi:hypothetical protein